MPQIPFDASSALLPPTIEPPKCVFVRGRLDLIPHPPLLRRVGELRLPGSKYYTLRYLLVSLLAEGESLILGPAISDDTAVLVRAMRALGATVTWEQAALNERDDASGAGGWNLRVRGVAGKPQRPADGVLRMGNAGAVLRLLLGIGALLPHVRFDTDHPDSLGRRPNADLLAALRVLGIHTEAREPEGLLPITLHGGPPLGGVVGVSGARSSQYLSALLYLAPLLPQGLDISVTDDLRSAPLVRATLRALAAGGISIISASDLRHFAIVGNQRYHAGTYTIPGDMPSAAALLAAASALNASLTLANLPLAEDDARALVAALHALGLPISEARNPDGYTGSLTLAPDLFPNLVYTRGEESDSISPSRVGKGLGVRSIDGDGCIDSVPALAAAACLLPGETRFERVGTLRLKESDRISDLCAELRRAGCDVEPLPDAIIVHGRPEGIAGGVTVESHDDHRLAQALAIVALGSQQGLTISGAQAVAKSYPGFFADVA
ncbi:MAG: 3-phosphoshikimate 1-carboxyvinyltransferase, partial [Ktedonobacterales bacterium]